jgi:hypothetical protein
VYYLEVICSSKPQKSFACSATLVWESLPFWGKRDIQLF